MNLTRKIIFRCPKNLLELNEPTNWIGPSRVDSARAKPIKNFDSYQLGLAWMLIRVARAKRGYKTERKTPEIYPIHFPFPNPNLTLGLASAASNPQPFNFSFSSTLASTWFLPSSSHLFEYQGFADCSTILFLNERQELYSISAQRLQPERTEP